jgi:hypothetical protein
MRSTIASPTTLLDELTRLVQAAARRPDLQFQKGESGCDWSFDWGRGLVTVNPDDLESLAPDLCRGLALHEASHAAVTVLQEILPRARLGQLMPLLNTLEDIRIEIWMRRRFPGTVAWIRAYNDLLYGRLRDSPLPLSRQAAFLRGILELWWFGTTTPGMRPEVLQALATCRDAITAATDCQPPLDDDRPAIVASQRAMWEIVEHQILPTWERLVALDRRDGLPRLVGDTRVVTLRHRGGQSPREVIATRLGSDGSPAYQQAWQRVGRQADRLGDELLQILLPQQRLRWSAGYPSGTRPELRRAMQGETDPTLHRSLWQRPVLPHRRDPAILLLIDRSGSMEDNRRMQHAFDGLVLLVEVCRRIGVPAAVWSFADRCRRDLDWHEPLDATARQRLGRLLSSCDGSTAMGRALEAARAAFAARHADPKLLFVLGDGEPDHADSVRQAISKLERDGVCTIGLGLGAGTTGLANFFPSSITDIPPSQLVNHLATLITTALTASV